MKIKSNEIEEIKNFNIGAKLLESKFLNMLDINNNEQSNRVGIHASSIKESDVSYCLRQQVLSLLYKRNKDPQNRFGIEIKAIFLNGVYVHEKWQNIFRYHKIDIEIERNSISKFWSLILTPDAIIKLNNKKYIVEIKSVNTMQFQKMNKHEDAEKQLQLYMHFWSIPRGLVLCEDKNNQNIKIFTYEYDHNFVIKYLERLLEIRKNINDNKIPNRKCKNIKDENVRKCPYSNSCWGSCREVIK